MCCYRSLVFNCCFKTLTFYIATHLRFGGLFSLVIVLLQIFSWFRQWKKIKNWSLVIRRSKMCQIFRATLYVGLPILIFSTSFRGGNIRLQVYRFPFPRLPSYFPPPIPFSLEVGPLNLVWGLGSAESPSRHRIWCIFALKSDLWWQQL